MVIQRIAEQYLANSYPFPDDGLKRQLKNQPSWYLAVANAILGDYINNRCCIPFSYGAKTRSISELREYAKGEQNINKYKPLLCHNINESGGKAYMNISWARFGMIPNFRNVIKGFALKTSYKISVDALDPSSISERKIEEAYWRLQTDPEWQAFSKEMQSRGVKTPKNNFQSEQQVNLWVKAGGLKLAAEIAMKTALEASLYLSKFDDSVKVQLIDDLIDLGICWTRDYVENGTKYVKARYVDPAGYIGRYSQFLDFNNQDYGAELRLMTIAELRAESDLTDAQLFWIAKKYQNDYGNTTSRFQGFGIFNSGFSARYKDQYGSLPVDDFKVPVLDAVYLSSDVDYYTKIIREGSGNLIYNAVGQDYKLEDREKKKGKELVGHSNERVYKFKYILDSDFVFDYGEDEDIAHDGPDGFKRAALPYHGYKLGTSSIVDLLIPVEDDMCLATYLFRNSTARMLPPPGVSFETGILNNLSLGGVKMTPKQALSMGLETGFLPIQTLTDHGRAGLAANSSPINPMPQTISQYADIYKFRIEMGFSTAARITGINDLTAAAQPDERQGKGVMERSVQLSNNVIAPLFKGYEVVFENTMRSCGLRWQSVLRNGDVKGFYKAIGSNNIEVFKLTKSISYMDFGLEISAMPTEEEINMLLAEITGLKTQNVTTGAGGISPQNFLLIYRDLKRGNIDLAMLLLANAIEEERMKDARAKMADIQANSQVQQQSLQANALATQAQAEQEFGYSKEELLLKAQIDKEARRENHAYQMEEIAAKGGEALKQKNLSITGDITKELIKPKPKAPAKK